MALLGIETGAFGGSPLGGFTESPLHARDVNVLPTSDSIDWVGDIFTCLNDPGDPPTLVPYQDGIWNFIPFVTVGLPTDLPVTPENAAQTLGTLFTPTGWTTVDGPTFQGNNPPLYPDRVYNGFAFVGHPGGLSMTMTLLTSRLPGIWTGSVIENLGGTHVNTSCRFAIVSADFNTVVDITPPGFDGSSTPLTIDTDALFGRHTSFYFRITQSDVISPPLPPTDLPPGNGYTYGPRITMTRS